MSEIQLPEGWVWKKLGDEFKIATGTTPSKNDQANYGRDIPFVKPPELVQKSVFKSKDYLSNSGAVKARILPENSVLVSCIGNLGKIGINRVPVAFNQQINAILVNKYHCPEWVFYYCQSSDFRNKLEAVSSATTIPIVNKSKFEGITIPLPPLPVQLQIVAKIEELFSELDAGVKELQTALSRLKTYRQAVLHHYLNNPDWERVKLGDVCLIQRGKSKHRPRNDKRLFGGNYPFIQTGEVREANGGVINKFTQTYSDFGLQQSRLWPKGTMCLTIAANIGETAFLGFDACFPDSVVGVIANQDLVDLHYINHFIMSYKAYLDATAPATAQKNINVEILDRILIPLPDLAIQIQIVSEIEARLSEADAMEITIRQELVRAENLRQSILKQAFSGKLLTTSLEEIKTEELAEVAESDPVYSGRNAGPSGEQLSLF